MLNLFFSPLFIALNVLLATSLPENLFSFDDTPQEPYTLSFLDANLGQDPFDSTDYFLSDSGYGASETDSFGSIDYSPLDAGETDPFSILSDDDLPFADTSAPTPSQNFCQADNDLTNNVLQSRDSSSLSCAPLQPDEPLNLPLDLFQDPAGFLHGIYPDREPDVPLEPGTYSMGSVDLSRLPGFMGRCPTPFIFQVCCDGGLGVLMEGSINQIFNCYWNFLALAYDKPFEGCCLTFVSQASHWLNHVYGQLKIDRFLRISCERSATLVMRSSLLHNGVWGRDRLL